MSRADLLSLIEVSERLGISPHEVKALAADGVLEGRRVGRTTLFTPEAVQRVADVTCAS